MPQDLATFPQFVDAIIRELRDSEDTYRQFLPIEAPIDILRSYETTYTDNQSALDTINIVLDFMSYCKNQSGEDTKLETKMTEEYLK